jgi:excisionase family DNA binding protein
MAFKVTTVRTPVTVDLLRGDEVAVVLGVSRALAYRWMQSGILPVVTVPGSRTVRVPRSALEEWIRSRTGFRRTEVKQGD